MTKPTLNHTFTITTGDPSRDGHNQSDTTAFLSNRSLNDIKKAYTSASRQYKIDITRECEEYEESSLSEKYWTAARAAFANMPEAMALGIFQDDGEGYDSDNTYVGNSEFVELWFLTAKLADPELVWEEAPSGSDHFIGGYGLYY